MESSVPIYTGVIAVLEWPDQVQICHRSFAFRVVLI